MHQKSTCRNFASVQGGVASKGLTLAPEATDKPANTDAKTGVRALSIRQGSPVIPERQEVNEVSPIIIPGGHFQAVQQGGRTPAELSGLLS